MNTNLKKQLLDSRQFVALLLALSSVVALIIILNPPDMSAVGRMARWQSEVNEVQEFGFLLPRLQSFIIPLLSITVFLALVNLWLCLKKKVL